MLIVGSPFTRIMSASVPGAIEPSSLSRFITLERLLTEEAPNGKGQTWATVIAQALLQEASKGDVRAISELANRIDCKPHQPLAVNLDAAEGLAERMAKARKRPLPGDDCPGKVKIGGARS